MGCCLFYSSEIWPYNNNNNNNNIYRGSPTRQGGFQWGPHMYALYVRWHLSLFQIKMETEKM